MTKAVTSDEGYVVQRIGFLSHDSKTQIKALIWSPRKETTSPKGIVQLIHGMAEYIDRYEGFASYLVSQGFIVCGHDQIGHGESVSTPDELGHMSPENGKEALVEDVHTLYKLVSSRYSQQTSYFMMGHSMGSFIARIYATRYGQNLQGVILSGTTHQSKSLVWFGDVLADVICKRKGSHSHSALLHRTATGAFNKTIENPRTPFDWISTDDVIVDEYTKDPLCGFEFSAGGYSVLVSLIRAMTSSELARKIPPSLPFCLLSGNKDSVGDNGKGVNKAADFLRSAGVQNVEVKLYSDMRHEIINEVGKQEVYEDIVEWLHAILEGTK